MNDDSVAGEPVDLDRIADALEGASERLRERLAVEAQRVEEVRDLKDAVTALVISTEALVIAVKGNTQRNRQFRWTMLGIALLLLIGVATAVVFQFRLSGVARSNHSLNKTVLSCVDPKGKCNRDGQTRTAAAVGTLEADMVRDTAAAAVCAREASDYQRVVACIRRTTASP